MVSNVFNPALWIGQGKKYIVEELPENVVDAKCELLDLPREARHYLPLNEMPSLSQAANRRRAIYTRTSCPLLDLVGNGRVSELRPIIVGDYGLTFHNEIVHLVKGKPYTYSLSGVQPSDHIIFTSACNVR